MQSISLEHVEKPGNKAENRVAYEALNPFVGKKVVLIFRTPPKTVRGNITRHHCTIESLWPRGITFNPVLHFPRKDLPDVLSNSIWFAELMAVEIKH